MEALLWIILASLACGLFHQAMRGAHATIGLCALAMLLFTGMGNTANAMGTPPSTSIPVVYTVNGNPPSSNQNVIGWFEGNYDDTPGATPSYTEMDSVETLNLPQGDTLGVGGWCACCEAGNGYSAGDGYPEIGRA